LNESTLEFNTTPIRIKSGESKRKKKVGVEITPYPSSGGNTGL